MSVQLQRPRRMLGKYQANAMLLFLEAKKRRFKKQLDYFQINQRFLGARIRNARQIGSVTWHSVKCEGYFLSGVAMTDINNSPGITHLSYHPGRIRRRKKLTLAQS